MDIRGWLKLTPALLIACVLLPACKKKPALPALPLRPAAPVVAEATKPPPEITESALTQQYQNSKMAPEKIALLMSSIPMMVASSKQAVKDRKELVLPPRAGWKPEEAKRKLKVTLIPEKTMIRKGEAFRYRLEIQNIGQERIYIGDSAPSFIKTGSLFGKFRFYVTPPAGVEEKPMGRLYSSTDEGIVPLQEIVFPDTMTETQKEAAVTRMVAEGNAAANLMLWLQPGETLLTRPQSPPPNRFRELKAAYDFDHPGTYRIKLVFDDLGGHPDVEERDLFTRRAKNRGISLQEVYRLDAITNRELGISIEQQKKDRQKEIQDFDKRKLTAIGRVESNTVLLEVMP